MHFQIPGLRNWIGLGAGIVVMCAVAACTSAPSIAPTPSGTITLSDGRYTPLGRVRVSDNPTASDYADLQSAEGGKLGLPAFVEFFADN